ncbi:MAG: CvpA family protein [Bacteroidaceae bacterium]|nr:CvpA family protein [Bacteroidaceae bacterium]
MILDLIIVIIMLVGLIGGIIKGAIQQIFSLGGLVLGIILGTLLYEPFAGLLLSIFRMSDQTARIVAFVIILLLVPMVCGLFGKALSKLIHAANLGCLDRLLGALFGLFKVVLIMGLVIMVLDMTGISDKIVKKEAKRQSQLYVPVSDFSGFCLQWTWNKVKENAEDLIPDYKKEDKDKDKKDQKKV